MSKLFIVATPIGNLADMTPRGIETLKGVDLILCEDTRVTKKLLSHYDIHTPVERLDANKEKEKTSKVIKILGEGKDIALVSDAGTPTISDPGSFLIHKVREEGHEIFVIPGPSAVTTALSGSGLPSSSFLFLGFLPHKKGRETLFQEIADSNRTVVFYESPHRILKTLQSLREHLGDRRVVIARELTKIYEEFVDGNPEELLEYFEKNAEKVKGEFVVMVRGK